MHPSVAAAFNLWSFKKKNSINRVYIAIIVDDAEHSTDEMRRLFGAWTWAPVSFCTRASEIEGLEDWLVKSAGVERAVLCLFNDIRLQERITATVGCRCPTLTPALPPYPSWENDAIRELGHHDYELGGVNEWDGADPKHSVHVLRRLSRWHSRIEFPFWAFPDGPRHGLKAIDIGCGPITLLRWGVINWGMQVTGVDPLIELYELIAARHGLDTAEGALPAIRLPIMAEDMLDYIPARSADFIYTMNALDHTMRPDVVMDGIFRLLSATGQAAVSLATREGTRQGWDQFHHTDIWVDNGMVMFRRQRSDARPLFDHSAHNLTIVSTDDRWTSFIVRTNNST